MIEREKEEIVFFCIIGAIILSMFVFAAYCAGQTSAKKDLERAQCRKEYLQDDKKISIECLYYIFPY